MYTCHVTPTKSISAAAAEKTGITCCDGQVYKDKEPVESLTPEIALNGLLEFMEKFGKPILIGHNIKNFDCPVLHNNLKKEGLWDQFGTCCSGFLDTLESFRKLVPNESKEESYAQEKLVCRYLGISYSAHDALEDITALERLYNEKLAGVGTVPLMFSCDYVERLVKSYSLRATFSTFIAAKHISAEMARKCSMSGLSVHHIRKAFERDGSDGVLSLLSEKVNGKPRITKSAKVIDKLCDGLKT